MILGGHRGHSPRQCLQCFLLYALLPFNNLPWLPTVFLQSLPSRLLEDFLACALSSQTGLLTIPRAPPGAPHTSSTLQTRALEVAPPRNGQHQKCLTMIMFSSHLPLQDSFPATLKSASLPLDPRQTPVPSSLQPLPPWPPFPAKDAAVPSRKLAS